jgi:hypothetical protein
MALDTAAMRLQLETRLARVVREIELLDATKAGGLPDVTGAAAVEHQAYKKGLYDEYDRLLARIGALGGPTGGEHHRFIDV